MKRLLLAALLVVSSDAVAGISAKVALNYDNTVDTEYPDGSKPQGGSCPSGWTCTAIGDGTCDVSDVDSDTFDITASGNTDSGDPLGGCLVYKTAATDSDLHLETLVPATSSWTGHTENYTMLALSVREGTADTDYYFNCFMPHLGTVRSKFDDSPPGYPWTDESGVASTVPPRYLGIEYDKTADELICVESTDAVTWLSVNATAVSKSLTFPVVYGLFVTSHDSNLTTGIQADNVISSTTLEPFISEGGGGAQDPVWDTPIPNQNWIQGTPVSLDISGNCSDPQSDPLTFSETGLPGTGGLSLSSGGVFSGTPNANDTAASPFAVTVTCSDDDGPNTADDIFTATVTSSPSGTDFPVTSGTSQFNCNSQGVDPGDTITLDDGTRGEIRFEDCFGTSGARIVIRNDVTGAGPTIIQTGSNDIGFHCDSCEYVTIDGTGKWSGAGSDGCGMRDSWPDIPSTPQCGIKIVCTSGTPNSLLRMQESSKNYTIKGVEFDGNYDGACTGSYQTLNTNDHNYDLVDHPGEWREGILIDDNYLHDTGRTAMYIGSNVGSSGVIQGDLQNRNNEISYNYLHDLGCDGIKYKTAVEGSSVIHHNYVDTTGLSPTLPSSGCTDVGIFLFESGFTDIYNNIIKSTSRSGISAYTQKQVTSDYPTFPVSIYNNLVIDSGQSGISAGRSGSDNTVPILDIQNNTVVNTSGTNINIGSALPSGIACIVRDNIVADTGSYLSVTECTTVNNNETGTEAYHNFVNAGADDYHLTSSSPARNSGTANAPATDLDDVARPQEGQDDIGAYEYVP